MGNRTSNILAGKRLDHASPVPLYHQAARALELFPDAQLHWFDRCGHFPQWDKPAETARLILDATRGKEIAAFASASKNGGEA